MGWDVVEIGLRHDLPVDDPIEAAGILAERLGANVSVIAECELEFDEDGKRVIAQPSYDIAHELKCVRVDDSDESYFLQIPYHKAQEIIDVVGFEALKGAKKVDMVDEQIIQIYSDAVYNLTNKNKELDILVYRENVDLDVYIYQRWMFFCKAFKNKEEKETLEDLRRQIRDRAKIFGCKEIIICADQGPGQLIYDNASKSADELLKYVSEYGYIDDYEKYEKPSDGSWRNGARHIKFSSYFDGTLNFCKEDYVDVVFDEP